MEMIKGEVIEVEENRFISIQWANEDVRIPLSSDAPNEVKAAFNKLIQKLQDGPYQIDLGAPSEDLFFQVTQEYVQQLNQELLVVLSEMEECGLMTTDSGEEG